MGCATCANNKTGLPAGCESNGHCVSGGCNKLNTYDWLSNVQFMDEPDIPSIVEVKFKGTRKGFYRNSRKMDLEIGDYVVTDSASGGYDVGHVSLRSELVQLQMKKYNVEPNNPNMLSIQRKATEHDLKKFREARDREDDTMIKSRKIARGLGLEMKISDVEYQGDLTKAIFYYTAEGRVDFRELIKKLSGNFRIKVEMKQVGLRQEAGRLGGIGSCGRELCCSTWLTDFNTVSTSAARYQNLFINPLKLAGQCGRLKCCLNYELNTYMEALESFPSDNTTIQSENGALEIAKTDILRGLVWLKYKKPPENAPITMVPFELERIQEFIGQNKSGRKVTPLEDFAEAAVEVSSETLAFQDVIGEDSLSRFEEKEKKSKHQKDSRNRKGNRGRKNRKKQN